jgi:hypothetical protein
MGKVTDEPDKNRRELLEREGRHQGIDPLNDVSFEVREG